MRYLIRIIPDPQDKKERETLIHVKIDAEAIPRLFDVSVDDVFIWLAERAIDPKFTSLSRSYCYVLDPQRAVAKFMDDTGTGLYFSIPPGAVSATIAPPLVFGQDRDIPVMTVDLAERKMTFKGISTSFGRFHDFMKFIPEHRMRIELSDPRKRSMGETYCRFFDLAQAFYLDCFHHRLPDDIVANAFASSRLAALAVAFGLEDAHRFPEVLCRAHKDITELMLARGALKPLNPYAASDDENFPDMIPGPYFDQHARRPTTRENKVFETLRRLHFDDLLAAVLCEVYFPDPGHETQKANAAAIERATAHDLMEARRKLSLISDLRPKTPVHKAA